MHKVKLFDNIILCFGNGGVAQLARASGSYPAGREFKSLRRYQEEFCSNFYSFEFDIQLIQKWISFFVAKNYPKRKDGNMVNIIKEELPIEEHLRKKLELICEFAKATPTIINGNVRKIDKTNLTYIEPNRIIIKDKIDKLKISKLNKDKYILSKEDKDSFIDFIEQVDNTNKEYDKI